MSKLGMKLIKTCNKETEAIQIGETIAWNEFQTISGRLCCSTLYHRGYRCDKFLRLDRFATAMNMYYAPCASNVLYLQKRFESQSKLWIPDCVRWMKGESSEEAKRWE